MHIFSMVNYLKSNHTLNNPTNETILNYIKNE